MEHLFHSNEPHWISISLPLLCEQTDNAVSILSMFSWQAPPQQPSLAQSVGRQVSQVNSPESQLTSKINQSPLPWIQSTFSHNALGHPLKALVFPKNNSGMLLPYLQCSPVTAVLSRTLKRVFPLMWQCAAKAEAVERALAQYIHAPLANSINISASEPHPESTKVFFIVGLSSSCVAGSTELRKHAEAAFVDGSCVHCEHMTMATLRSRLSFVMRLPSSSTQPSSMGHKSSSAAPVKRKGDLRITVWNDPSGQPPRKSDASTRSPVELPKDGAGSSCGEPSVSFGAPEEDRTSIAASKEGLPQDDADDSAEQPPLRRLLRRSLRQRPLGSQEYRVGGAGSDVPPRSTPVPFFPEVREQLTKMWRALYNARSPRSSSSLLTTLDGGVARGYIDVPQVERAVHLCLQNAATCRNRPRLPSKASRCQGLQCCDLHAMAILQVHRAKAVRQLHQGVSDPRLIQELRTVTDFALRAQRGPLVRLASTFEDLPSSSRWYRNRQRQSNTSCPVMSPPSRTSQRAPPCPLLRALLRTPARLRSGPDTDYPEMEEIAL
ncbi:Ribosomal protein S12 methylthiotransferase RimO [Labeo rohita]|uniref:Ribosomal protein S12 methylthiotransferase RimO n=1 Tax=Labeo rohita TaxID=84645 RepID=A0ABQ8LSE6_LABRO|nr:Ribosomal protein S12 methylthiotransferase RimO [Labeo rohita]